VGGRAKKKGGSGREDVKELNFGGRVKELRLKRKFTLQNLSDRTGLSIPLLSQIENSIIIPSLSTVLKLARVLDVSMAYLFQEEDPGNKATIIRTGSGEEGGSPSGYVYESLVHPGPGKKGNHFTVEYEVGPAEDATVIKHGGEKFGLVVEGGVELLVGDDIFKLNTGDAFRFDPSLPHAFRSRSEGRARIVCMIYYK